MAARISLTAAGVVQAGLTAQQSWGSSVIDLSFRHVDPAVVQPVLNEIIAGYQSMHTEVHGSLGTDDFAAEETQLLRSQIAQTERELMTAKTNAGILTLDDAECRRRTRYSEVVREPAFGAVQLDTETRRRY